MFNSERSAIVADERHSELDVTFTLLILSIAIMQWTDELGNIFMNYQQFR